MNNFKCLLLVRVSTTKGAKESEGPNWQLKRGLAFAEQTFDATQAEVLIVNEIWSGRDEQRPGLDQAFDLAQQHNIPHALFFDIDRFTRAGAMHYELQKRKFAAIGCTIHDVKGIIQPATNSLTGTGGSFGDDFQYEWSVFSTSEKAEIMEAQMAKDEARKILGRTVPAQIQNAQAGRTNRMAPYGFRNIKIVDASGKPQPSKQIDEGEAFFVRKIYEGLAVGKDIRALCDEINALGFRTRTRRRWNADYSQVVGNSGNMRLDPWKARKMVERPIYAGFVCEKWTHDMPVPANHDGLVTLDVWNRANEGHWQIVKDLDSPTGWRKINTKQSKSKKRNYRRARADFPFKLLITCPICGKPLKANYSRSRNGSRYGYYQCARGHKQVSERQEALHALLRAYLGDLRFTSEVAERFEQHLREVWAEKVGGLNRHLVAANAELNQLREEANGLIASIRNIRNPDLLKRLESDYETVFQRIKLLEAKRDEKEYSEADMNRAIAWAKHLVEHLDELIVEADDDGLRSVFWSLVFERQPTLAELQNRTAPTSPLVRLKDDLGSGGSGLAHQNELERNRIWEELIRWYQALDGLEGAPDSPTMRPMARLPWSPVLKNC